MKKSIKKRMNYVRKLIKIKKRQQRRQAALDKINDLVTKAMTNITNDRTNQQVNDSTNQALDDIALVTPDHIVRATARDAVKQQYEVKSKKLSKRNMRLMKKNKLL